MNAGMRLRRGPRHEDDPRTRLERAERQLELFDALGRALERRTEVCAVVDESEDEAAAISAVQRMLDISETAARAVLDLQLRSLTAANRERLADQARSLRLEIARLRQTEGQV